MRDIDFYVLWEKIMEERRKFLEEGIRVLGINLMGNNLFLIFLF